ncbi:hypothetical protein Q428_05335 [Fervidicella metallireducens AeB]|uniref:Uncharacterized protein n=1 Tax=Fervidicella metallireducens AeB TaxID=1403537 RepID=A0A017RWI0_9CLOT|nr:hypothetical protein [Fervidicella metallireducens]EYE88951.1 hypothetical protein Q428_05335 [Fervidicella metallireducens AeB]
MKAKEMQNKIGKDALKTESFEDEYNLQLYGETVPSAFNWMTPEEQRRRVDEINNMIEDKNDGKAKDVDFNLKNNGLQ